jgi:hypothetical protein
LHSSEKAQENETTGYEDKWSQKNKTINYIEARF